MTKNASSRFDYLDSLRGIAACMVLGGHAIAMLPMKDSVLAKYLYIFFNGDAAVSFFFVLSGMVLSYKYLNPKDNFLSFDYPKYVIQRIFRIYPAFWVSLIGMAIYGQTLAGFRENVSLEFLRELSLLHGISTTNGSGWTLGVEIGVSMILPFWLLIIQKSPRLFIFFLIATFFTVHTYSRFCIHFQLGILLAYYFDEIQKGTFTQNMKGITQLSFLVLAFFMFTLSKTVAIFPVLQKGLGYFSYWTFQDAYFFEALGASIFLIQVIRSPLIQKILRFPPLLFIGKISYSIYLIQASIVWFWLPRNMEKFLNKWGTNWGSFMAFAACFVICILVSVLLYYLVEVPFLKLGAKTAKKLFPST